MEYFELHEGISSGVAVQVPVWDKSYDIIVAGGGCAGVYCALSAAKEGKQVLLIEKSGWCGGMHVQGLVNGYYYSCRGGLYEETDKRSMKIAEDVFYDVTDAKRLVIRRLLEEAGVTVAVSSIITGVYAQGQTVTGVRAYLNQKVLNLECRMLVDATSDGHVLRILPIPTWMGRAVDHEVQPFSSVRNVYLDKNKYDGGIRVQAGQISERYTVCHEYRDNGYVNQYDEACYTEAIIRAHASHLHTIGPEARFLYLAPQIGIREGVLYEGEQMLTLKNLLIDQEQPENILLYGFSDVDKHGSDLAFDEKTYQDWFVNCNMSTCTVYIPLPVGAVVPKGWKGFITSGRCLSTDSYVNSAIRMNVDCFRIGEACGVLASMAADHQQSPMRVPYEELKGRLEARGFFEGSKERRPSFWWPRPGYERIFVEWMKDVEKIRQALATDCPAVALWSCHLLGKEAIGDAIWAFTGSGDEMLRYNAAIALGVMQDERALPVLREIIKNRRPFYFMDGRRSNQMRSVIAICLCGQMGDREAIGELFDIIRPEEYEKPMYHELLKPNYQLSIVDEQNSVYFQHFSHAVAALVKIAGKHPECREEIAVALHAALDDGAYIRRMTQEPEQTAYYQAAENCRRYVAYKLG